MKKFVTLGLSLMMVLSLAACGDSKSKSADKDVPVTENGTNEPEGELNGSIEPDESVEPGEAMDTEGGEDASDTVGGLVEFLSTLSPVMPTDAIIGTGWEFAGGMLEGVEMEAEDASQTLELYGGTLNVIFDDAQNVSLVQGSGTLSGTYTVAEDTCIMKMVFDNNGSELKYAGVFTDEDGTLALMLLPDETGQNVFYFTQITEG